MKAETEIVQRYKNLSGNSGVVAYEFASDSIDVQFTDRRIYRYTVQSAGRANIERMKRLALAGRGLSTFISREVKDKYASKRG